MNKLDREHCLKCVWHGVASTSETSGQLPYCNYSAVYGHESRIKRHYDRVGKEDLTDFRSGVGCYEFFEGDSKRAKTLMTDDPSRVMRPGWELLAEVAAHEEGREYVPPEPAPKPKARSKAGTKEKPEKVKAPRKKYRKAYDIDPEKLKAATRGRKQYVMAKVAGMSATPYHKAIRRGSLTPSAVTAILQDSGIDVRKDTSTPILSLNHILDVDRDAMMQIKDGKSWAEVCAPIGVPVSLLKGSFSRGKINANVAEKLFEQYGIDVTRKEDDE